AFQAGCPRQPETTADAAHPSPANWTYSLIERRAASRACGAGSASARLGSGGFGERVERARPGLAPDRARLATGSTPPKRSATRPSLGCSRPSWLPATQGLPARVSPLPLLDPSG